MNLTAARMKIKFLDEPDHHGATVPMRGLLLDCGHSQMKSWIPVSNRPRRNRQTQLYGADSWALCGVYRLPMTSDSRAVWTTSLVTVLRLLISIIRWT